MESDVGMPAVCTAGERGWEEFDVCSKNDGQKDAAFAQTLFNKISKIWKISFKLRDPHPFSEIIKQKVTSHHKGAQTLKHNTIVHRTFVKKHKDLHLWIHWWATCVRVDVLVFAALLDHVWCHQKSFLRLPNPCAQDLLPNLFSALPALLAADYLDQVHSVNRLSQLVSRKQCRENCKTDRLVDLSDQGWQHCFIRTSGLYGDILPGIKPENTISWILLEL